MPTKKTGNIEFVHGQENHTSFWGKYYVKELDSWKIKEDFPENRNDKHHSYNGYTCNNIPAGTLFTVFEQSGDKRGTDVFCFSICEVTDEETGEDTASYGSGWVRGNFRVIVQVNSKTKAPRLMDWWNQSANHSLAFAKHCEAHINKRGLKILPPMPIEPLTEAQASLQAEMQAEMIASKTTETLAIGDSPVKQQQVIFHKIPGTEAVTAIELRQLNGEEEYSFIVEPAAALELCKLIRDRCADD